MTRRKDPKPQQRTETETRVEPYKSLYNGISNGFQDKQNSGNLSKCEENAARGNPNEFVKWQQTEIDGIKIVSCVSMEHDSFENQPALAYDDCDSDDDASVCTSSFSSLSEESEDEEGEENAPTDSEESEFPNLSDVVNRTYVKEKILSPSRLNISMGHLLECCDIFEPNFVKIKKNSDTSSASYLCSKFSESMRVSSDQCRVNLVRLPECMAKGGALSEMAEHDDTMDWLCSSEIQTVGNLFSKLKLTWPRPERVSPPKTIEPPLPSSEEASPERSPIKITLRRTSSITGSDSEPGPYVVSVGGAKKRGGVRRTFVTKRTTVRRPRQTGPSLSLPPPEPQAPSSAASSVADDSASSSTGSESDFDPDPEHVLGCRSYEVENFNLNDILSLTIPFEDPGLFRSPRAASKAAQLKNKQTLGSVRNQTAQNRKVPENPPSTDSSGNIRRILRTMELKSLSEHPEVQEPELPSKNESNPKKKRPVNRRPGDDVQNSDENDVVENEVAKGVKRGVKPKPKTIIDDHLIDESSLESVLARDGESTENGSSVTVDAKIPAKSAKRKGPKRKSNSCKEQSILIDESSQDSSLTTRSARSRSIRDDESLSSAPPSPIPESGRRQTRRLTKSQDPNLSVNTRSTRSNSKLNLTNVPELEDPTHKPRKKISKTEEEDDDAPIADEEALKDNCATEVVPGDGRELSNQQIMKKESILRAIDKVIELYAPPDEPVERIGELTSEMSVNDACDIDPIVGVQDGDKKEDSLANDDKTETEKVIEEKSEEENVLLEKERETEEKQLEVEENNVKIPEETCTGSEELHKTTPSVSVESPKIKVVPDKSITETRQEVLRSLGKILAKQRQQKNQLQTMLPKRMLRDPRVRARLQREHEQVDRRTEESPRSPEGETTAPVVTAPLVAKISPWPKASQDPVVPPSASLDPPEKIVDVPPPVVPPRPPTAHRSSRSTSLNSQQTPDAGPSVENEVDEEPLEEGEIRSRKKKKSEEDEELTYKSPLEALESTSKKSGYQRPTVFNKRPIPSANPRDPRRYSTEEDQLRAPTLNHKTLESNLKPPEINRSLHPSDWSSPPVVAAKGPPQPHIPVPPPKPEPEMPIYHRRPSLLPTPPNVEEEVFHRRPRNFKPPVSQPTPLFFPRKTISPPRQQYDPRGRFPPDASIGPGYHFQRNPNFGQHRGEPHRPQSIVYEDDPGERYLEEFRRMENGGACPDPYNERLYSRPSYDMVDYERVPTPPPPQRWKSPSPLPQHHFRHDGMMRHDCPRSRSRTPPRWKRRTPSPPQFRGPRRRTPSPFHRFRRY